ncbi:MAG: DUF4118 domain-containing protein [Clostridia bacterium]|nr:DUF4118 domain-containing protein [Clostridia bacterium]
MTIKNKIIKNIILPVIIFSGSFCLSLVFQKHFGLTDHITTVFIFAVFIISLLTDGYLYGIIAALLSTVAINYAFTFPYFVINFTIPQNMFSALIMLFIAILTSTLTTKIKQQEILKSESEKERMRANLLRAVSHDLRTPLTTIYGSSSALIDNMDSFSKEQQTKMLNGIKEDSDWLIGMVENLLSITRIDSGQVDLIKSPTVLEELIDSVMLKFKKRYPAQHVDINIPDEMVIIPMDALLIQQVLINIMENAVHHAVGMTKLELNVNVTDNKAIFEVHDNGCGIESTKLPNIFRGTNVSENRSADTKKRNAGIGLSVCSTIIKAHGGEIYAKNADGAVFGFILNVEE